MKDISEELKSWGHGGGTGGNIILKSDGERALMKVKDAVARYHGGRIVQQRPAKGESRTNGVVDEAGQVAKEFVKVLGEQIKEKAGIEIGEEDDVAQWMVRWAAMRISRQRWKDSV